jgi:hypothetical protein
MKTMLVATCFASLLLMACGGHEETGEDAPTITGVTWVHVTGCVPGTPNDITVTVTAVDPNTPVQSLSYSGSASGCTGQITGATSTINCPEALPYQATVTVSDEEAHNDMMAFTIMPCADGSAP